MGDDGADAGIAVRTISMAGAQSEIGFVLRLYRDGGDDPLLTYDELARDLEIEAAGLPVEQWRDGVFNVGDYIVEARGVGIYDTFEVMATIVTRDSETVLQYADDDGVVVAERLVVDE